MTKATEFLCMLGPNADFEGAREMLSNTPHTWKENNSMVDITFTEDKSSLGISACDACFILDDEY